MNTPRVHAELIKAWADGAQIQYLDLDWKAWADVDIPSWDIGTKYRIKSVPKPDIIKYAINLSDGEADDFHLYSPEDSKVTRFLTKYKGDCVKFIFDGETGIFKSVEKI